jgi:hypothetical protein
LKLIWNSALSILFVLVDVPRESLVFELWIAEVDEQSNINAGCDEIIDLRDASESHPVYPVYPC